MENDAKQRSGASGEIADLRAQLRINLAAEFGQALRLATALTDDQRQALSKLVVDEGVTAQTILKCLTPVKAEPNE